MKMVLFYVENDGPHPGLERSVRVFDPGNNGVDVGLFAEEWPHVIYFEVEVVES